MLDYFPSDVLNEIAKRLELHNMLSLMYCNKFVYNKYIDSPLVKELKVRYTINKLLYYLQLIYNNYSISIMIFKTNMCDIEETIKCKEHKHNKRIDLDNMVKFSNDINILIDHCNFFEATISFDAKVCRKYGRSQNDISHRILVSKNCATCEYSETCVDNVYMSIIRNGYGWYKPSFISQVIWDPYNVTIMWVNNHIDSIVFNIDDTTTIKYAIGYYRNKLYIRHTYFNNVMSNVRLMFLENGVFSEEYYSYDRDEEIDNVDDALSFSVNNDTQNNLRDFYWETYRTPLGIEYFGNKYKKPDDDWDINSCYMFSRNTKEECDDWQAELLDDVSVVKFSDIKKMDKEYEYEDKDDKIKYCQELKKLMKALNSKGMRDYNDDYNNNSLESFIDITKSYNILDKLRLKFEEDI